jgi:DNA-binding LacI/PurR family transcriptional regulator
VLHIQWKKIADAIRASIESGELHPGDTLPSENDLAAQWKVSRMTVHRAMQELQRGGLVIRRRRLGTVVASPPTQRSGLVALLFHNQRDLLEIEYLYGVRSALFDEYHLVFCDLKGDPLREAEYLRRMQKEADGILWIPTCDPQNTPLLRRIVEAGTPVVCLDRVPEGVSVDGVETDNYHSTLYALRHLLQRGHRIIAHFTQEEMGILATRARYEAYLQAMAEAGVRDPSPWVRQYPIALAGRAERLTHLLHDSLFTMLRQPEPPTAVFCVNDYFMVALLEACEQLKVAVPEELEILSFNDSFPLMPRYASCIHRIVQQAYKVGQTAAERLHRRIQGEVMPAEVIRIPAQFFAAAETLVRMAHAKE